MDNRLGAYGRLEVIVTLLENGRKSAGETQSLRYTMEFRHHLWDPLKSLHMEPSPLLILTDSLSEGLASDIPPRLAAKELEELNRVYSTDSLERF